MIDYEMWREGRKKTNLANLLSPQEERAIRLRAQGVGLKEVAHLLGVTDQTIKNHMGSVYRKLDADSLQGALFRLGWTTIPDEPVQETAQCSWVGRCGRAEGHRGHHGGFRVVPR